MIFKLNFPTTHIKDNEIAYFNNLESAIFACDQYSITQIEKANTHYVVRISPSKNLYINSIIKNINNLNNSLQIRIDWSKSSKASGNIFFILPF